MHRDKLYFLAGQKDNITTETNPAFQSGLGTLADFDYPDKFLAS